MSPMKIRDTLTDNRGYSLMELMVAVAILGITMGALIDLYRTGNTIAMTGENKAEAQQGARGGTLQMEEELRVAGYGFPPANTAFVAATPTSVTFWADLTNTTTTLQATANPGATSFTINTSPGTAVAAGDIVYLINQGQSDPAMTVTGATSTTVTVAGAGASTTYPVGSVLGRPRQITYAYDGAGTVTRNAGDGSGAQVAFTGVSAFQLTYFNNIDASIPSGSLATNLANIRRLVVTMTVQSTATLNRGTFTLTSSVRPRNVAP